MSIATVLPSPLPQFLDDDGKPLAGGKLYSFEAGLATPQALYTTPALTPGSEWSNPLILDASGRPTGPIYMLASPAYKFRMDDANDVTVWGPVDAIIASAPSA